MITTERKKRKVRITKKRKCLRRIKKNEGRL